MTVVDHTAEKLRCVLIGEEPLLVRCGTLLLERGAQIVAVVSKARVIADWAATCGLPLLERIARLDEDLGPVDYLFSIANLSLLPPRILSLPARAAINFHDGPLPEYAGLNAPVWALLNGEAQHGVVWHAMTETVDGGDILLSRRFAIDPAETAHSLNLKCHSAALESFGELLDRIEGGRLEGSPQVEAPHHYFGSRDRPSAAATIDWTSPGAAIERLVRALDFGGHANPLDAAKILTGSALLTVASARFSVGAVSAVPGTILDRGSESLRVAAVDGVLDLRLGSLDGAAVDLLSDPSCAPGTQLPQLPAELAQELGVFDQALASTERFWRGRLRNLDPLRLPQIRAARDARATETIAFDVASSDGACGSEIVLAAVLASFARCADQATFDVAFSDPVSEARVEDMEPWFASVLPLRAALDFGKGLESFEADLAETRRQLHRSIGFTSDLVARTPDLRGIVTQGGTPQLSVRVQIVEQLGGPCPASGSALTIRIARDGTATRWTFDPDLIASDAVQRLQRSVATLLAAGRAQPGRPIAELPMDSESAGTVTGMVTGPRADVAGTCIHEQFAAQAARTPAAPAVTCRGETLTYAALESRSNRLAHYLRRHGVGPEVPVALAVPRSLELVVAMLAIQKAGGAYVPLDPEYPSERRAFMIRDAAVPLVVTTSALLADLPGTTAATICLDRDAAVIAACPDDALRQGALPHNPAYIIYTSGSTGQPKGVVVEHRNVDNFFTGMDATLTPGGTWLAVTSLSFDISVLELSWTLARGFHVILASGDELKPANAAPTRPLAFSLFYFGGSEGTDEQARYKLLLDGARFADTHGFSAVWTPERHFDSFGGLYPNPSVTSAAIAAVTSRVDIRAGSVVLPLHHPARVAEEWAVVDSLSGGRAGIAFASGWQPNDFVLRPESYSDRTRVMLDGLATVRRLWRGEAVAFTNPLGQSVPVRIYPRPLQPELPVWITSAGNEQTFAAAGTAGTNLLTHLLGQNVAELAAKIAAYRTAWREAGHPGEGQVTLMLHSFVGPCREAVRTAVREPLMDYLRTSTGLLKQYAWSFPAFARRGALETSGAADFDSLTPEETDALLEHAFDRYYESSGLFGTPEDCVSLLAEVGAAGVDEIACLIDFGVPADVVLEHLPHLDRLRQLAVSEPAQAETLPALIERHGVTHLQCTPSRMRMLLAEDGAGKALSSLKQLLLGGEAFPPALAGELRGTINGDIFNMYGPTETTIWSATHRIDLREGAVPLGRPLANQAIVVVDSRMQPVPIGLPGEIVIGGSGVTRGYLNRPELTAERFVSDPWHAGGRLYRTGDLGRLSADGTLEFLGRLDHQVKIRGHRIEVGEIEALIGSVPGVLEAAVSVQEFEAGDVRLAGFFVPADRSDGATLVSIVRDRLRAALPEFMIPAQIMPLAAMPHTPNGKLDRQALRNVQPVVEPEATPVVFTPPAEGVEATVATIWADLLKVPRLGRQDNFFDLGGHSLLAVQLHRRLRETIASDIAITDIFRFPTIAAFAAHLESGGGRDVDVERAVTRAHGRLEALKRRRGARAPSSLSLAQQD